MDDTNKAELNAIYAATDIKLHHKKLGIDEANKLEPFGTRLLFCDLNEENRILRKEIQILRKQLKISRDIIKTHKEEKPFLLEQVEQLHQVTKERDVLSKQLLFYKHKYLQFRNKSTDLEVTLSRQEKDLQQEVHVLELEVEKLKKENSILEKKEVAAKSQRRELVQKGTDLLKEKRRCWDLEEKLEWAIKEKEFHRSHRNPTIINIEAGKDRNEFEKNCQILELKEKLIANTQKRTIMGRDLERKDREIAETKRQCEELKCSMSRLPPIETLQEIPKCKWIIREQCEKIMALKHDVNMFQQRAEEYKSEYEKLVDKFSATKKLYLNERMRNMNLTEALNKSGVQQPTEDKSGDTQHLAHSDLLQKLSGSPKKQGHTQTQSTKSNFTCLPPISSKCQPQCEAKSFHIKPLTPTKKVVVLKSEEKLDLTTKTRKIQFKGQSSHNPLPPIVGKSQRQSTDKDKRKFFMTETDSAQ